MVSSLYIVNKLIKSMENSPEKYKGLISLISVLTTCENQMT